MYGQLFHSSMHYCAIKEYHFINTICINLNLLNNTTIKQCNSLSNKIILVRCFLLNNLSYLVVKRTCDLQSKCKCGCGFFKWFPALCCSLIGWILYFLWTVKVLSKAVISINIFCSVFYLFFFFFCWLLGKCSVQMPGKLKHAGYALRPWPQGDHIHYVWNEGMLKKWKKRLHIPNCPIGLVWSFSLWRG